MRIEHVALGVQDLEAMKTFYCQYFDATANDRYHNPKTGLQTYFLTFADGARLEIMSRPEIVRNPGSLYQAGYLHLAFQVGSKSAVDQLTAKLASAGYPVLSGPRTTGDGYYESCVLDPEHNQIEIVA